MLLLLGCHSPPPTLWFAGDVHLGATPSADLSALNLGTGGVVNLEGPIAAGPGGAVRDGDRIVLTNPDTTGEWLARNGVIAATLANNHADDLGPDGRRRTRETLAAAGVTPVDPAAALAVTLLAYRVDDGIPAGMAEGLAAAGDWSVVSLHVDGPPSLLPRPALRAAALAAIAGGADVVVAHGTHALAGVERIDGAIVAWGLGNLTFDCSCTDGTDALVLRVTFAEGLPAAVLPVRAGLGGASPTLGDAALLDLVDALGLPPLLREGVWARVPG